MLRSDFGGPFRAINDHQIQFTSRKAVLTCVKDLGTIEAVGSVDCIHLPALALSLGKSDIHERGG